MRCDCQEFEKPSQVRWDGAMPTNVGGHCSTVRGGFTLVEMLIVIAIVALIAALGVGALLMAPRHARIRATEALIAKIDALFQKRMAEFNQLRDSGSPLPAELVLAGGA